MRTTLFTIICGLLFLLCSLQLFADNGQIDIATLPFTISNSGSYVVVKDLSLSTQDTDGITISANNVTIDLNGHALIGPGKAVGASGSGIVLSGSYSNIAVRNGTIRDWRNAGVFGNSINSLFEFLRCYSNGSNGIEVGLGSIVRFCNCNYNGYRGISGESGLITGNTCTQNDADGIMGNSSTISSNTCTNNAASGINAQGGVVSGNTCSYNIDDGIYANVCLVSGNFCSTNTGNGIRVWSYSRVIENTCYNNGYSTATASGIRSSAGHNSIENNVATSNDYGIYCTTDDFFVGNRAHNNTISDFSYPSNCLRGQVIDGTAGGVISTTDPYANLRF